MASPPGRLRLAPYRIGLEAIEALDLPSYGLWEATLEVLTSLTSTPAKREKHRRYVSTIVPLGMVNARPGFTEYARD
jgi:hypothetical protein